MLVLLPNTIKNLQYINLLLLISIQISLTFLPVSYYTNINSRRLLHQQQEQIQSFLSLYNNNNINNIITKSSVPLFFQSTITRIRRKYSTITSSCCYAVKKSKSSSTPSTTTTTNPSTNVSGFGSNNKNNDKKKIKSNKSASTTTTTINYDNDYAIFPPLDDNIIQTMIPSIPILYNEAGILPDEIYQRLHQIYGFPNFNHPSSCTTGTSSSNNNVVVFNNNQDNTDTNSNISFHDLISVSTSSLSSSTTNSYDALFPETESADSTFERDTTTNSNNNVNDDTNLLQSLQQMKEFSDFRVLHIDPMVLAIDNFFTNDECDRYIQMSTSNNNLDKNNNINNGVMKSISPTVGKDTYAQSQRTSTTYYHYYNTVPELISKATRLLGLNTICQWEEPQTVCYKTNEKFTWHLDALGPNELVSKSNSNSNSNSLLTTKQRQIQNAGQRIATLLVYLTDMSITDGGATMFRDLRGVDNNNNTTTTTTTNEKQYLSIQPKKGTAILFFPAAGGIVDTPFDIRTIHCGQIVKDSAAEAAKSKWIAQLWLRTNTYHPSAPPNNQQNTLETYTAIQNYCNQQITNENADG